MPLSAAPVAEPNAIVVTGKKLTPEAVSNFIESVTADSAGQIAMFKEPIWPASFGLPESLNRVVQRRLSEDAVLVGLGTAREGCEPNVIVIVADSPGTLIAALVGKPPDMFARLELSQIQEILKTKEPARTWQAIEPRGADGRPLERLMFVNGLPAGPHAWANYGALASRLRAGIRPRLVSSFVVIDADAAEGLTLTQIADYAAMRTLARTRVKSVLDRPTILAIIDGGRQDRTVGALTAWDLAYLRALCRTSNGVSAQMQHIAMASAMKRELASRRAPDGSVNAGENANEWLPGTDSNHRPSD